MKAFLAVAGCLLLHVIGSVNARLSVDNPHDREVHGPSVRHLAEKMAKDSRTGIGVLTDDDVALLFLCYQQEFNRSLSSGAYTHASMTEAFYAFAENARRYASLLTDPDTAPMRGIELGASYCLFKSMS